MDAKALEKFLWRRRVDALETMIRTAQSEALTFWMLANKDKQVSVQTMHLIHDLTAPVEIQSGARNNRARYLAADAIDAAAALRRGGNSMVVHVMDQLASMLREYVDLLKEG